MNLTLAMLHVEQDRRGENTTQRQDTNIGVNSPIVSVKSVVEIT